MSASDRVQALRDQLAAAETEEALAADLLAAKQAHGDNPNPETRQAKQDAALALRAHRAETRSDGVSVGGDAFVSTPEEV